MKSNWLILIVLGVFLAACEVDPQQSSTDYLSSGLTHFEQGRLSAAEIELKNSLAVNPNNAAARFLLGQLYVLKGDVLSAEKELGKAQDLGIAYEEIVPYLAMVYLQSGRPEKVLAIDAEDEFLPAIRSDVLAAQGAALMLLKRFEEAEAKLNQALTVYPDSDLASTFSASLALAEDDRAKAREFLNAVLQRNERYALALSKLGDLESLEGNPQEAKSAYEKAVAAQFNNTLDRWKLAIVLLSLGELDRVEEIANRLKSNAPRFAGRFLLEGMLALTKGADSRALEMFEDTLRTDTENKFHAASLFAATSAYKVGRIELAELYADQYRQSRPNDLNGIKIKAYILAKHGDAKEVVSLLKPIVAAERGDLVVKNLLASALISSGEEIAAIRLLESLATTDLATAESVTRIGLSLLQIGETDAGLSKLQTALELDPEFDQAALMLALGHIEAGQLEQAVAEAERYRERVPNNPTSYNILGTVYAKIGEMDGAKAAFLKADELDPGNSAANHQLALMAAHAGDLVEAEARYSRILEGGQNNVSALVGLAKVAKKRGDYAGTTARLQEAIVAAPNSLQPRVLLARQLINEGNAPQAVKALADKREEGAQNPFFLRALGEAETASNDHSRANKTYQQLVSILPRSAEAHYLLAQSFGVLGDVTRVRQHLRTAIDLKPQFSEAQLAYAKLEASAGDWEKVGRTLDELDPALQDYEEVALLAAQAAYARGDTREAKRVLRNQLDRNPSEAVILALVQLHAKAGETDIAKRLIDDWLLNHPDNLVMRQAAAEIAQRTDRDDVAIGHYQAVLKVQPDNAIVLNNLSELMRQKDPELAYRYAKRAVKLLPESPYVLDTLSASALAMGSLIEAETVINKALSVSPNNPVLTYRKGIILQKLGRVDEGRALIEQARAR